MEMKRFTLDNMCAMIDAVMSIAGASDKSRHDIMRLVEHTWAGRGTVSAN